MDHLERINENNDKIWHQPHIDDIQNENLEQIVPCKIIGVLKLGKHRRYEIENLKENKKRIWKIIAVIIFSNVTNSFKNLWSSS